MFDFEGCLRLTLFERHEPSMTQNRAPSFRPSSHWLQLGGIMLTIMRMNLNPVLPLIRDTTRDG